MKCKDCGKTGFSNPVEIRKHKIADHGASPKRKYRRRAPAAVGVAVALPPQDPEAKLVGDCTALFVNAGTDAAGDARVLAYLNSRFGPEAYADPAEDAEPADDGGAGESGEE